MATVEDKIKEMTKLLGEDTMTEVLRSVIGKEAQARNMGLVAKEKRPVTGSDLVGLTPDQIIELGMTLKELQEQEEEEKEASSEAEAMKSMLEEMKGFAELMKGYTEELKGFGGRGKMPKKPMMDDEAAEDEEEVEEEAAPVKTKKKEATATLDPNIARLATVVKELSVQVGEQGKLLQQLTGASPASRGYRPSGDQTNVLKNAPQPETTKEAGSSGFDSLVSFMMPNGVSNS
jgi:hypothetical protein